MICANAQQDLMQYQCEVTEHRPYIKEGIDSYVNSSSFYSLLEIKVGETKYKLLSSIDALVIYNLIEKHWECHNPSGKFKYIGISKDSQTAAIEDFKIQIHVRFQQLYSKRPFEMTEDEHDDWIKLANTIDLLNYKTTAPLKVREIGCISYKNYPYPYRIKWLTDENYIIKPSKVPGELMSYKPGQWVEAIVERCPVNHNVLGISSVRKIKFHVPRPEEARKYWDNMGRIELDKKSS